MYRTDGGGEPPPPANMRAAATRWPVPRNAFRGAHNSWMHVLFLAICRERVQTMLPADTRTCTHIYAHVDNKNDLSYTRELLTMIIMSFIGTHLVSSLMHFFCLCCCCAVLCTSARWRLCVLGGIERTAIVRWVACFGNIMHTSCLMQMKHIDILTHLGYFIMFTLSARAIKQ